MSQVDPQETLALPLEAEHWSLTTLREKLVKIGAKVVSHGRYVTFQLAEVAVPRPLFAEIFHLIDGLRPDATPFVLPSLATRASHLGNPGWLDHDQNRRLCFS